MARTVIVTFAIFLVLFEAASCLKCYHCISSNSTKCPDPLNATDDSSWDCNARDSENFVVNPEVNKYLPSNIHANNKDKPSCFTLIMKTDNNVTIHTCLNTYAGKDTCDVLRETQKQKPHEIPLYLSCYSCNEDNCNKGTDKEPTEASNNGVTTSSPKPSVTEMTTASNRNGTKSAAEMVAFSLPLAIVAVVLTYI